MCLYYITVSSIQHGYYVNQLTEINAIKQIFRFLICFEGCVTHIIGAQL